MAKAKPITGVDPAAPVLVNAAVIVNARLDETLQYEPCLSDPERVFELHQMRIAAKRLRYTMEMFEPAYAAVPTIGKTFKTAIDEVKQLQEHLGEIHDADVLMPQLLKHLARMLRPSYGKDAAGAPIVGVHQVDIDACNGLLTICSETRQQRDERYVRLIAHWTELTARNYFEDLRAMLRSAVNDAPKPEPAKRRPRQTRTPAGSEPVARVRRK